MVPSKNRGGKRGKQPSKTVFSTIVVVEEHGNYKNATDNVFVHRCRRWVVN
ncbi:hypothetical protein JHK86_052632 [Glycine max]|nr:hypothetical protein JHK86_052632 [Glycine max]